MLIQVVHPFKMDGSSWGPEFDVSPHGFRKGREYNLPDDSAQLVIKQGWGHKPGEQPVTQEAGTKDLQPDNGILGVKTKSP